MDVIGTETSMCLQYGVPLQVLTEKFSHMRFEPSGWTQNPDIPNAKSVVDYIFRWMAIQFIPGYREANTPKRPEAKESTAGEDPPEAHRLAEVAVKAEPVTSAATQPRLPTSIAQRLSGSLTVVQPELISAEQGNIRNQQFAKFQSDAPACDNCGAITVRNGNCYLCHNCGNSLGCS